MQKLSTKKFYYHILHKKILEDSIHIHKVLLMSFEGDIIHLAYFYLLLFLFTKVILICMKISI